MYPQIILGKISISSYYILYTLGGITGGVIGWILARDMGIPRRRMLFHYAVIFPLAILAGFLNGVLFNPDFIQGLNKGRLVIENWGIVSYGVILTALFVTAIFSWRYGTPVGRDLDRVALVLPIMLAIFRIGCLLHGCCYGRETNGFGGVFLPNLYQVWENRYPTQIMLFCFDLALSLGLWGYQKRSPAAGRIAIAFIIWFGLGRALIDPLRELAPAVGPFSLHEMTDLLFFIIGVSLWIWSKYKERHRTN